MNLYNGSLAALLILNSFALYRSRRSRKAELALALDSKGVEEKIDVEADRESFNKLCWRFFPIYLLVNAADWLQGPYIYPIYKDEKGLPEEKVAFLFLIGFISAGISASFVGALADRYGRRTLCLAYCVIYSLSCSTLLSNNIYMLFFGRVLGGICGTVLWSVFETWLVAEFNKLQLHDPDPMLSSIFSTMTTSNTCVAIGAGILAEWLVARAGTAIAPFMASVVCLVIAFFAILRTWSENYGSSHGVASENEALLKEEAAEPLPKSYSPLRMVLTDRRILVLALTSCFFEGSLFLFIFFKFPALKLSHKLSGSTEELPFGLIFAVLMCSMMLGSLLYKRLSTSTSPTPATRILVSILAVASLCFFIPANVRDERVTLWCFCIFELCCGLYYPVMSSLKGKFIEDGARASIYGILRVPLNLFVVLALSTTREGEVHRDRVFTVCCALLIGAAVVVNRALN